MKGIVRRLSNFDFLTALWCSFKLLCFLIAWPQLQGVKSLQCQVCNFLENPSDWCTSKKNTTSITCNATAGVTTCHLGTGIRAGLVPGNPAEYVPGVTRDCSLDAKLDNELWKTMAKGQKMVCTDVKQDYIPGPSGVPLIDRKCICTEDNCNKIGWDEIMQQPALPANYTPNDKPQPSQIANYSLAALQTILKANATSGDSGNVNADASTTAFAKGNDTATNTTAPGTTAKDAAGSGTNMGLIAGIAIGVIVLAAVAGGLFYWFKIRKRKESTSSSSGATGGSGNSRGTGGSADDD
ncbi:uncharacterized protein LOC129586669 [Paramacrobiotus metropolitanus]|uniref:uncharacterized protein LOC129586669 n=1 Tax=Paramacrobiotus metropolitanus TaxID=2943436 RepID=UPI002445E3C4|nr:uncharacterized protein LOC129586669 [Paramacrobiotus metropolitanus]